MSSLDLSWMGIRKEGCRNIDLGLMQGMSICECILLCGLIRVNKASGTIYAMQMPHGLITVEAGLTAHPC